MYRDVSPCKALKTIHRTLKSVLYLTGCQYRDACTGVMLFLFLVVYCLAIALCTISSSTKRIGLQKFSLEKINVVIILLSERTGLSLALIFCFSTEGNFIFRKMF